MKNMFKAVRLYPVLLVAAIAVVLVGATLPAKPKPSAADQKIMAKSYRVPCLECNDTGALKYKLNPIKVTSNGGRSVPNGTVREILLHFRCPVRHEFSAPGPDQFIPAIRAEEEK